MARRVFFSFHYEKDIWRASQVRNSWVTKPDRESAGFWDWEKIYDSDILDGHQWQIELIFKDRQKNTGGSNSYPEINGENAWGIVWEAALRLVGETSNGT